MIRLFVCAFLLCFTALPTLAQEVQLSSTQKELAEKLRLYLDDMKTLSGGFAQISSSGEYADGKVYLQRPGKMRLIYNPPQKSEIIVRRGTIIYHDKEYQQVNYYPLNATPLSVLLEDKLTFDEDVRVIDLQRGPGIIEMTLQDVDDPGMGSVSLLFADKPLALRKWTIVDAQGVITQVSLLDPVIGGKVDPKVFDFQDPKYNDR